MKKKLSQIPSFLKYGIEHIQPAPQQVDYGTRQIRSKQENQIINFNYGRTFFPKKLPCARVQLS